jgi:hypothetical protein
MSKGLVLYYSAYGHIEAMAAAVAKYLRLRGNHALATLGIVEKDRLSRGTR